MLTTPYPFVFVFLLLSASFMGIFVQAKDAVDSKSRETSTDCFTLTLYSTWPSYSWSNTMSIGSLDGESISGFNAVSGITYTGSGIPENTEVSQKEMEPGSRHVVGGVGVY